MQHIHFEAFSNGAGRATVQRPPSFHKTVQQVAPNAFLCSAGLNKGAAFSSSDISVACEAVRRSLCCSPCSLCSAAKRCCTVHNLPPPGPLSPPAPGPPPPKPPTHQIPPPTCDFQHISWRGFTSAWDRFDLTTYDIRCNSRPCTCDSIGLVEVLPDVYGRPALAPAIV